MAEIQSSGDEALVSKAENAFLTPESERTLTELIELRKRIDGAIVQARKSAENILKTLNEHDK